MINVGTDLLLVDGDIVFDGDNLATVSSDTNVKQQAYLRMLADKGESVFFPDFGTKVYQYANKPYNEENARKVESEARAELLQVGAINGIGWIEKVLECRYHLTKVDGKAVKTLYIKYLIRDETLSRELSLVLGGDNYD
jgi:hypothetical protein